MKKILFIQTAFLGDVVFSTALLRAVAALYRGAEITFLASPRGGGILEGDSDVTRVVLFDKGGGERGAAALWRFGRRLRREGYDIVLSPHRSLRSAILARLSGAPVRVGFRDPWSRWAYNAAVPHTPGEPRPYRRELELLRGLGAEPKAGRPRLTVSAERRAEGERLLESRGVGAGETIVAVVPGTVWPTKKWPVENFRELARRLSGEGRVRVLVVGGPSEAEEGARIAEVPGVVNLAGETALSGLPALLDRCTVVVAGDTGPLHAAMALDVPVVALFGPTDEKQFEFDAGDACLTLPLDCRPCRPHGSADCPAGDWQCLPGIDVERVEKAVLDALSRSSRPGAGEVV